MRRKTIAFWEFSRTNFPHFQDSCVFVHIHSAIEYTCIYFTVLKHISFSFPNFPFIFVRKLNFPLVYNLWDIFNFKFSQINTSLSHQSVTHSHNAKIWNSLRSLLEMVKNNVGKFKVLGSQCQVCERRQVPLWWRGVVAVKWVVWAYLAFLITS